MSEREVICFVCERLVETYKVEIDYHKGREHYGFKTIYPHEEKHIEFPEGRRSGIHVCQDCLDKPHSMKQLIKLARIRAVQNRIERADREDEWAKRKMSSVRKRRKENKVKAEKLREYLKDLEADKDPKYEWDELEIDRGD